MITRMAATTLALAPGLPLTTAHAQTNPPAGRPGGGEMPGTFRHTEGILAFYRAEPRVTTQRAGSPAPEQLDLRVVLLTAQLDAAKADSATGKGRYAALSTVQRKLADTFLADHMRGMRGPMP